MNSIIVSVESSEEDKEFRYDIEEWLEPLITKFIFERNSRHGKNSLVGMPITVNHKTSYIILP